MSAWLFRNGARMMVCLLAQRQRTPGAKIICPLQLHGYQSYFTGI
jgi:hypothetical protein